MVLSGIGRWRLARRYAGGLAAFGALAIAGKACSDLTAPAGVNAVTIQFRNLPFPRPDTLQVVVGDSIRPDVVVMLGAVEQERARYVFSSSDPNIVRVYASGDSIAIGDRGSAMLIVSLVGTTIGNNRPNAGTRTADTVVVVSAALNNAVNPATVTFDALGAKLVLDAQSFGRDPNTPINNEFNVVWRSTDPAVATVDATTGEVTAVGNGAADIYAIFEGVDSTFSRVTVLQQLKRYILTTPATANLRSINETMQVSARAVDSLNNTLGAGAAVPPTPAFVSDNPGKIEIAPATGVMTARGNTTDTPVKITATVGGATRSDTLQVTVSQVAVSLAIQSADTIRLFSVGDQLVGLGVVAPDALGTQVPPTSISWTSSDPARVQVVGTATATVTAQATGTVVLRARADQQIDSVVVVVTNDPDRVTLSPNPLALKSLDETQTLTATVTNTAGTPLAGIPVTWASRDSTIAEPQGTPGVILARAVGETRVVVSTPNGRSDSVTVRVTNAPDTVNIVPTTLTLPSINDVDGSFVVDFKNARGVALPRTSVNWSSQDITIARVLDGVITAVGAGATYIVAVSPENALRRDSVRVTVTNGAASLTVSPATPGALTSIGATLSLSATVRNAAGDPIAGAPVTWSVPVGAAFVSVDASGVVTALANGVATVRGTSGSATGDVNITVGQVASLSQSTVIPAATSLVADGTSTTTVAIQLRDANGNNLTFGGATIVPSATRGSLGGVTDNGAGSYSVTLTSGTAAGPANVSVTANGQTLQNTGQVSFTAGAASQYVVTVSPSLTPLAGAPVTISARLADVYGNSVGTAGNVVTWSSTGGGSFSAATSMTDGTGLATVSFTTSTTVTTHTVTATTGSFVGTSPTISTQSGGATQYVVTPATTSPAAGSGVVISAQLLDASNNPVSVAGQTVTWSKSDANGAFSAATSVTNGLGVATVTLTTHTVTSTATTVTATSAGPLTGTSATVTTVAGPASQLTLTQAPSATAQSGVPFAVQPVVQVHDVYGNPVLQANISVTATITAGGGSLSGVTMVQTDVNGLATFTDLAISGTNGGRTITFSTSGASSATAGVTIGAGLESQMAMVAGNGQSALAGASVAIAPSVVVRDASSNPVTGVNVTFTVTGGAGMTSPPSGGTVSTDASGVATLTSWTLGSTAGTNSLTASVPGLTGSPVTFTATGTTGAATQMTTSIGAQTATVNTPVSTDPSVLVRDANNNPVSGVAVTFTVTGGGGSISSPTGATVVTNAAGVAALSSWTLGTTAGANSLDATSAGLPTVIFTATGAAGPATVIAVNAGNGQSAPAGTDVAVPPSVLVRDAYNNAIAATPVTFTLASGGGTMSPVTGSTVNTDAAGVAGLASWTLGNTVGSNSLTAAAAGLTGSPVLFTATGTVGVTTAAQSLVVRTGSDNITANGSAFSEITVTLRDQFNNPVPGKTISLDDAGSTSVIAAPSGTTSNSLGEVRFIVTNTTAEVVTYTATATDPGAIVITQTAQVTFAPSVPQNIVAVSATSQNAIVGTSVAAAPSVQVRDANFNGVAGINVTFTLTASGGVGGTINPGSPITIPTNALGVATLTSWTLGQTAGTNNNTVTAAVAGLTGSPVTFQATGENPVPTLATVTPSTGFQGEVASPVVLTGTGFVPGTVVSFDDNTDITINSTTVNSSTQITITITIGALATTGVRNVMVTNALPGGGSASAPFSITSVPVPTLTGIAPATAERLQTLDVVLTGTGFGNGLTSVNWPAGITQNSLIVNSRSQITANISLDGTVTLGANSVTVTTPGGTSGAQTLTVSNPVPTIGSVSPSTVSSPLGGTTVASTTIFGTGFVDGTLVDFVEGDVTISGPVTVISPTEITVMNINYPGVLLFSAPRNIRVTNAGQSAVTSTITLTP